MAVNISADPNYWQMRAREAWSMAAEMTDGHTEAIMVGIAQGYEKIAEWVEQRTRESR
jgi:hypothetical protein